MTIDRMDNTPITVPRGLTNVVAAETSVGDVRGHEGFYHYRQYSAVDLARHRTFDDVWRLVLLGELPAPGQEGDLISRTVAHREIPAGVRDLLPGIASISGNLMTGVRTALAGFGAATSDRPLFDLEPDERLDSALAVAAVTPSLLAALYRIRNGEEPVAPRDDLGHVANYLYMLTGELAEQRVVDAISAYMVCAIDHGFNASTFTARVIASTGADMTASVVGGLGALSGPLHGGAPSRALEALDEVGTPDRADAWAREAVLSGRRIMGFGHPVYRTEDPRSAMLKEIALELDDGPRVALAITLEESVLHTLAELKPGRALHTNVEYYAAVVMELCGLPPELFSPTFSVARVVGWTGHILEQVADGKIIRPSSRYVGPPAPEPLPESQERATASR